MWKNTAFIFANSNHTAVCDNYSTPKAEPSCGTSEPQELWWIHCNQWHLQSPQAQWPWMFLPRASSPAQQDNSHLHSKTLLLHLSPIFLGKRRSILLSRDKAGWKQDKWRGIILFSSMALSSNWLMQEIDPTAEPLCLLSWKPGHGTI